MFDSRVFHIAKDVDFADEYEDAFHFDRVRGIAAIADGVSSAIFSRDWADILTQGIVEDPPNLLEPNAFSTWLAARRVAWIERIDVNALPWNQKQKLRQVGGGYSTLLWIELTPAAPTEFLDGSAPSVEEDPADAESPLTPALPLTPDPSPAGGEGRQNNGDCLPVRESPTSDAGSRGGQGFRCRGFAVGDCCLFHVRNNDVLSTFPIQQSAEFEADPLSISSANASRDHLLEFRALDEACLPGDLLVLATDAYAKWAMTLLEAGESPRWDEYWTMSDGEWAEQIALLRRANQIRYDDTTLLLLRVGEVGVEVTDSIADTVAAQEENPISIDPEVVPVDREPPSVEPSV